MVVHSGRIEQTGEHARSDSESVTDGGEAEVEVQVLPALVQEESKQCRGCVFNLVGTSLRSDAAVDFFDFILGKKLCNITDRKDIVDVHKELV
jgi:hypothetical protein